MNLPSLESLQAEIARRSFKEFVRLALPHVETGSEFLWSWHLDAITDHLQALHEGRITRLIINMPPRFSKSTLVSVLYPAWVWISDPTNKIISTSFDEPLALRDSMFTRELIKSEFYRSLVTNLTISDDQSQKRYFTNNHGGHRLSRGINSGSTGHTANLLIADDPMSVVSAYSDVKREAVLTLWKQQLMSRLTDRFVTLPDGTLDRIPAKVIIVMQRLHHEDLTGVYADDEAWDHLILPMVWEGEHRSRSSIGWKDPRTKDGELLFPEYKDQAFIDEARLNQGNQYVASQFQQRPIMSEGSIIKIEWIRTYRELPHVKRYSWSFDTAFKTGDKNDYSVGTLWAECDDGFYLVDLVRKKLEYTALKSVIQACYNAQPSSELIIEEKASGQSLVQDLKRFSSIPVVPVIPGRDMPSSKEERLQVVAGLFEAGKVKIPEKAPWAMDFIKEITEFGFQKNDDIVDSTTQYLFRVLSNKRKVRITVI